MNDLILQPILFMGLLSLVMMLLMYVTRIPAAKVLEAEGVEFDEHDHVDLKRYRWHFPDYEWPQEPLDPD